ncbi:MAG TPA: hemerythrin domain-containing protein [Anaerolineales bacterium]
MTTLTQPLRDEHRELYPEVERILTAADLVGRASVDEVRQAVDAAYKFLAYHLLPHAQAEDAALYPTVQQVLGSPEATRTMSRDHVEVGRYIDELAALKNGLTGISLTISQITELRRVLYGLYAMVKLHFAKEEEVYLPILDQRLTPEAATEMFERMEAAAHKAKHALHGV